MAITQFRGAFQALSNYSAHPAYWEGVRYPTAEHAFAAAKTLSAPERQRILSAASPGEAKRIGRSVTLRPGWDDFRTSAMRQILVTKFAPGSEALAVLLGTGAEDLVEGNGWHDQFWGDCSCGRHTFIAGQNHLGRALMALRWYFAAA